MYIAMKLVSNPTLTLKRSSLRSSVDEVNLPKTILASLVPCRGKFSAVPNE